MKAIGYHTMEWGKIGNRLVERKLRLALDVGAMCLLEDGDGDIAKAGNFQLLCCGLYILEGCGVARMLEGCLNDDNVDVAAGCPELDDASLLVDGDNVDCEQLA